MQGTNEYRDEYNISVICFPHSAQIPSWTVGVKNATMALYLALVPYGLLRISRSAVTRHPTWPKAGQHPEPGEQGGHFPAVLSPLLLHLRIQISVEA